MPSRTVNKQHPVATLPRVVIAALTVFAISVNVAFVWPQAVRVIRSRSVNGVSAATWVIAAAMFAGWVGYSVSTSFWALLVPNLSSLAAAVVILVTGVKLGWSGRWVSAAAVTTPASAVLSWVFPKPALAVVTALTLVMRAPQLMKLLRSPSVADVSITTWLLSGLGNAAWFFIANNQNDGAVMVSALVTGTANVLLVGVLLVRRYGPSPGNRQEQRSSP